MILANKLLLGAGAGAESKPYVEFVSSTPMTITPKYTNSGVTLEYSLDGSTWTAIASGGTTPSANIIYFIGSVTGTKRLYTSATTSNAWKFTGATNLECNGKLDRLLQDTLGEDNDILTIGDYCFSFMFWSTTTLIKAPELPATTLAIWCYVRMFERCSSLTTAPTLPATTLADNCYNAMLRDCLNLTIAPELPATTLAKGCYTIMFYGCTNLTTAPALSATILAEACYRNMFNGCTNLTTAPALSATILAVECYNAMFNRCASLTTLPELPATTLAVKCYYNMFGGCTSLTTVPKLPATTLQSECYQSMFSMCSSLKISTTMTGIYDTAYRIPTVGTGTTTYHAVMEMFTDTGGTFIGTPDINTTYYIENTPV